MDTAHQFGRQVKALTKKNVISRWRNKTRSLAEILVPLVALLIVHGVSYLVEPTTIPETLPDTSTPLSGGNWMDDMSFGTSLYRPIPTIADLYTRSEAFCKHKTLVSRCEYSINCDAAGRWWEIVPGEASSDAYENASTCQPMQIGVAPQRADNANAAAEAANFVAWGNAAYGASNYPPYVLFASNDALESHTTSKAYSYASGPGDLLGAGIVFGSGYPDWDVTLRLNRTIMSSKQRRRMPRTIDPELTTTIRNNNDDADYGNG